jgi:uncharacterized protein (DUF2147 family)
MQKILSSSLVIFLAAAVAMSLISAKSQTGIEGKWKDPENGGVILIYEQEGRYFGKVIAADDPAKNEKIQEHGAILVLKDFKQESPSQYCCGTLFQPKEKRTLSATLTLENENTLKIEARYGFLSGTRTWTRL